MAGQVLQELSREPIVVAKFEETTLAWHENYLSLMTEKGVHIFELSHNISSLDKKINWDQSLISHPKSSPMSGLFTNRIINKRLRNIDQTEMIVDHSMWPHNLQLLQDMSSIVDFKWSPTGAVNNYESAIAVLTNVGVIEIYRKIHFKWECIVQISELLALETKVHSRIPQTYEEAKDMAHMLATSAMCWSPMYMDSCFFVTAQKNGNIIFWLIECNSGNVTAKTFGTLQIESCEMQAMLWIPVQSDKFLLVCSNVLGQIIVFECQFQNEVIELLQSYNIWSHKDKMITKFLEYVDVESNIVLFCNKNRHLLVLLFDKECNVLGNYVNNINDYRITNICKAKNEIFITTVNCKIHKLNMAMEGKELNITLDPILAHGLNVTHELFGFVFSPTMALSAMCVADRKINSKKEILKLEIVVTSTKQMLDSLIDLLISNSTKLLRGYWDVIETLRYKCLKTKEAPSVDYVVLYENAASDIYTLKVYNLFCNICNSLKKTLKIGSEFQLPESNSDTVKEEILVAHAEKVLHKYSEQFKQHGKLSPLEMEYFTGAKKFLEYFFTKNKKNLSDVMDPNIMRIVATDSSFICQCCDEEVIGFKCKYDHMNMFCALTFTPIESDSYLVCKICNLTARLELLTEKPLCLFCDIPLLCVDDVY